ncbi:MAG: hypothetical protein IBX63_03615 [Coriobacteriia bacterium]|nr:hypothetical protein [Coriobacteriia bacterium]
MSDGYEDRSAGCGTPVCDVLRSAAEPMSPDARERVRARVVAAAASSTSGVRMRTSLLRAVVAFVVLALAMTGVATAASDSLPGDVLYSVKRAIEQVHIALTSSNERQADVYFDIADERIREIERLMNTSVSARAINEAVEGFRDAARRAVDLEPDEMAAQRRADEIRKRVEGAPAAVRDAVESELRQLDPIPSGTPSVSPVPPESPSAQPDGGDAEQEGPSATPAPPAPLDSSRDEDGSDGQIDGIGDAAIDGLRDYPGSLSP